MDTVTISRKRINLDSHPDDGKMGHADLKCGSTSFHDKKKWGTKICNAMRGRLTVAVGCPVGSIVFHSQGRDIYDSAPLPGP
jgi:hypothetical protein